MAIAVSMQLRARDAGVPAPSPNDLVGAIRISLFQHTTTLGFALAALLSGFLVGEEASNGSLTFSLLADSHRFRRWLRKVLAGLLVMLLSVAVSATALRLSAPWTNSPSGGANHSPLIALAADGSCSALVLVFVQSLALVVSLALRSSSLTIGALVAAVSASRAEYPGPSPPGG